MWIHRTINSELYHFSSLKLLLYCNKRYLQRPKNLLTYRCQRCLATAPSTLGEKYSYGYDEKTDSFRPKEGPDNKNLNDNNRDEDKDEGGHRESFKRYVRNILLLTGGVVWVGIIGIIILADMEEVSEMELNLKDTEEEVRLFAFYDIAQSKIDLAAILSKEKIQHSTSEETHLKESALHSALAVVKNLDIVSETLGKPVQLLGYRAAAKIDQMLKNFQDITTHSLEKLTSDDCDKHKWSVECLLEGPKGIVSLLLEFERQDNKSEWIVTKVSVSTLEKSNDLFELAGTLPHGVNLNNK